MIPAFNVLVATIGRPTLRRLLDSLCPQLMEWDHLTVASDDEHDFVAATLADSRFACRVQHRRNPARMGSWGHPSRTLHQNNLAGDFVMHADDDNSYMEGSFDAIRRVISQTGDWNRLYLFRVDVQPGLIVWGNRTVAIGNVDTACGVIPNRPPFPEWPNFVGGDGAFYIELAKRLPVEFVDHVIYRMRR